MLCSLSRERIFVVLSLVVLTLCAYVQAYRQGFVPLDDGLYVTCNPRVQSGLSWSNVQWALTTTTAANWHPVTWISHMLDCQLFGLRLGAHHLVNVLFHLLNVLLLLYVFETMTGALWPSAVVAAIFAVHPLHVESVAWIAERKDVLSTFFWLMTMAAYIGYTRRRTVLKYLLILLPFILGLMTKPMLVTLPCVLLLMDFWPLQRLTWHQPPTKTKKATRHATRSFPWFVLIEKLPLLVLAGISSAITYYAQQRSGAVQTFDLVPLGQRLTGACVAYASYLLNAVWPAGLSTFYPLPPEGYSWPQISASVLVLAVCSTLVLLRTRKQPWLAVGWFWFLGTLVPVIGLVQVGGQAKADRYMYVPLIGLAIMAAWGVPALIPPVRHRRKLLATAAVTAIAVLAVLCWRQASYWQDNIRLYRHEVQVRPGSAFAHSQLGCVLRTAGCVQEAREEFLKTLEIQPCHVDANLYLGIMAAEEEHYEEAVRFYSVAIEHGAGHPNRAEGEIDLGVALSALGRNEEALKHYEAALALEPDSPVGHYDLANLLACLGRRNEALVHYQACLRLQPGHAKAREQLGLLASAGVASTDSAPKRRLETAADHYQYGNELAEQNRFTEAVPEYEQALRLNPKLLDARINLGATFASMANPRDALAQFQEALKSEPNNAIALLNAGNALVQLNQFRKALQKFDAALRVDPRQAGAHYGRGVALDQLGYRGKASEAYSKALELDPSSKLAREGLEHLRVQN